MSNLRNKQVVKWISGCWLLVGLLLPGLSRPVMAEQGPVEVLQTMTNTLIEIVSQDPGVTKDTARLRSIANDVVLPRIDFNALSRWVLGKYWRTATPQQRSGFISEFREMLLGSYLSSVSAYKQHVVRFLPFRGEQQDGRAIVNAEVEQPDGPVIHVSFRMHRVASEWLIYDVSVEGVSLVATHRAGFSQQIHSGGMDSLIASLHARNTSRAEEDSEAVLKAAR